jgi:hypothetical protein
MLNLIYHNGTILYQNHTECAQIAASSGDAGLRSRRSRPTLWRSRCRLEVFGESAIAIEPSRGAFDDPAVPEDLKTDRAGHATHNLDRPVAEFGERIEKLVARIGAVGEEKRWRWHGKRS